MGFLLIVGVLVAVTFRRRLQEPAQAEMESSAERLQFEMQRSADEIISRLSERIDQLEKLVEEADQRSTQLEWQLARMKDTEKEYLVPETEPEYNTAEMSHVSIGGGYNIEQTSGGRIHHLVETLTKEKNAVHFSDSRRYSDGQMGNAGSDFSKILQNSLDEAEYTMENEPIRTVMAMHAYGASSAEGQQTAETAEIQGIIEEEDEISAGKEKTSEEILRAAQQAIAEKVSEQNTIDAENRPAMGATAVKVRELVREGYSAEDISRRMHLGRGAIELIRQMDIAMQAEQVLR